MTIKIFSNENIAKIVSVSRVSYLKFLKNFSNIKDSNVEGNSKLIYTDYFSEKFDYVFTFERFIYLRCYDG